MLFPLHADAATVIYVRKGVTGNITFNNPPVPNCRWKVGKTSILKLKSSTSRKAVYYGRKVGKTTLTAYNKNNKSQKYTITVYVMPSGKLIKKDFEIYGDPDIPNGSNFLDSNTSRNNSVNAFFYSVGNSTRETTRTARLGDSLSRIRMLYGKSSLVTFKKSKDRFYDRELYKYQDWVKKNIKYYSDYKYGSKYRIRFYFNSSKKVSAICFFKNYDRF